jgi:hypothetical protein
MSRRIYWLLPDVASARRTVNDLLARVPVQHIHCFGREGINLSGLHPANVFQTTDVIYAAELGLLVGGATGLAAGLLVAMYYPLGFESLEAGIVVILGGLGALFGAWTSSLIGISVPSHRLKRFEAAIEQGEILLMADVPGLQVKAIEDMLHASHPEARLEGGDLGAPVFP